MPRVFTNIFAEYRPLSLGGYVEFQENKSFFCTASLALNSRLGEACRAKTNLLFLRDSTWPRVTKVYSRGMITFYLCTQQYVTRFPASQVVLMPVKGLDTFSHLNRFRTKPPLEFRAT